MDLVRLGTPARMESAVFDSMLEGYVEGTVVRVAPESAPASASAPALYEVDIDVQKSPYPLVLGSGVDVRLLMGRRPLSDLVLHSGSTLRQSAKVSHE